MVVSRFDVFLISPDTARGSELRKTRPCIVVSPDELNKHVRSVIVAPMITKGRRYPARVSCIFQKETRPSCSGSGVHCR